MAIRRGRPKRTEVTSWHVEEERALFRRGIEAYLDASYRTRSRASASEFARQFDLHPDTLTRKFRRLFGVPPLQYLRSQQLMYAARLLRQTAQTVDEIAEISGLGTRTTFFRLFAARFGMTPDAYRTGNDPGKRRKS
jgi:AraC-like DNA-binding protein